MSELHTKRCESCEGIGEALNASQVLLLKNQLDKKWLISSDSTSISRPFSFKDFYETMGFMNAVAWIANLDNHHPDVNLGYNYCTITLTTHALKGLTHNDFIIAAKIDKLMEN